MKNELEPNIEKQLIELKQEILKIEDIEYDKYIEKLKQIIEEINQKEEKLNKLIENRNTLQEYKNQLRHIEKRSDAYNTNEYTNILKARYKYMSSSKLKNKLNKLARILLELDEKEENTLWNFIISIVILRKKPEFLKENGVLMHLMLEEYYIKNNGNFWLAIDVKSDKIVGSIAIENRNKYGILKRFYVNKEYQKLGIGNRLYKIFYNYVKEQTKMEEINLACGKVLKDAHKFYIKNNFKQVESLP